MRGCPISSVPTLPIERLRESLAQSYPIDRELGRGGMSAVFLANDCKHRRSVAIKVLNPELAASLGPKRFLEQASGETNLDGRSDQYSPACVVYEMLSGERPFNGSNAQAIMAKRFTETARPLRTVRAAVPENIERAVAKAMSTDPSGRYTTTAQFALALSSTSLSTPNDTMVLPPAPISAAKSVAVLPFADMSADKDNEYFTDGMAEEIIDALSKIQALRVTSRTSSFAFKGKNEDISEIGRKPKVSTVLEGSVRKVGNRLRITAKLVNVTDGYQLWSERYDREMEDVFEIQDDISQAIDRTLDRAQGGLGIGLALVKRLVEMHGGTVSVESAGLGTGSTFTLRLPTTSDAEGLHNQAAPMEEAILTTNLRVLVVDDNVDAAEMLAQLLSIYRHDAKVANSGPLALAIVPEFRPALVFLDIGMPGMDGYETARRIRADDPSASVTLVALTGWGAESDRIKAREAGFDHHFTKPVELGMVESVLQRVALEANARST